MTYSIAPSGVCSSKMIISVNEDDVIENVEIIGGCKGNSNGICALVKGMNKYDVINKLQNITCGSRSTSCPAELARALAKK